MSEQTDLPEPSPTPTPSDATEEAGPPALLWTDTVSLMDEREDLREHHLTAGIRRDGSVAVGLMAEGATDQVRPMFWVYEPGEAPLLSVLDHAYGHHTQVVDVETAWAFAWSGYALPQVNWGLVEGGVLSSHPSMPTARVVPTYTDLAYLGDRHVVVSWYEDDGDGAVGWVRAIEIGVSALQAPRMFTDALRSPHAISRSANGVVLAWMERTGSTRRVLTQWWDADLEHQDPLQVLYREQMGGTPCSPRRMEVAVAETGGMVMWYCAAEGDFGQVQGVQVDGKGVPMGDVITFARAQEPGRRPVVAAWDGGLVIAWEQSGSSGLQLFVRPAWVGTDGALAWGDTVIVDDADGWVLERPDLAVVTSDDEVSGVITYEGRRDGALRGFVRRFRIEVP